MATLAGSGLAPRASLRIERLDGTLVEVANADANGDWSVDVAPGDYVVSERYGPARRMSVGALTSSAPSDVSAGAAETTTNAADEVSSTWVVRHGDTAYSDTWAVLDAAGDPLDLSLWEVLAQARDDASSNAIVYEWTKDHGVTIGSATVQLAGGAEIETSTIRLYLEPTDYTYLPRDWSGVFDVEITLVDGTDLPVRRYTVVEDGHLRIRPDVSRA